MMKRNILASLVLLLMVTVACADKSVAESVSGLNWLTNLEKAQEIAAEKKVPILVNFTGSDWCQWCTKLTDEVFSTETFNKYAAENLVLVKLDFPRNLPQSDAVKEYNKNLMTKYGVRGFPTILILDEEGKKISQLGYQPDGPEKYIQSIENSLNFLETHKEDTYVDDAGLKWFLTLEKAAEVAQKEGNPILVNFTGSDWCQWCFKIRDEIFSKKEFVQYAEKNLVLLQFDFPRKKKLSDGFDNYNRQMAAKFGIQGFPTILIIDEKENVLDKLGYQPGGPMKFIESIEMNLKS